MSYIVGVHCKYCGHESFDVCTSRKQSDRASFADRLSDECPECGRKLVKNEEAYYCKGSEYSNEAAMAKHMKEARDASYEKINQDSETKCNAYIEKSFGKKFAAVKVQQTLGTTELREYLHCIMQAYGLLFYSQNQLRELMNQNVLNRYALKYDESSLKAVIEQELVGLQSRQNELTQLLKQCADGTIEVSDEDMASFGFERPEQPKEPKKFSAKKVIIPEKPCEPVYGNPGLFNKKRVLRENEEKRIAYEAAMKNYEEALASQQEYDRARVRYEERLASFKEREKEFIAIEEEYNKRKACVREQKCRQLSEKTEQDLVLLQEEISVCRSRTTEEFKKLLSAFPSKSIDDVIDGEIKKHKKRIDEIAKKINELYSYDVIYPKYRDYVAVSQMFEYIDAGRCTALEGAHGAYNLYESDIKANLVIQQLTQIVSGLEDVRKNQGALYAELKEVTGQLNLIQGQMRMAITTLSSLSGTVSGINYRMFDITSLAQKTARNTEAVANNTALTAYYAAENAYWSKKNAELTNSLGFLIAMK